MVSRQRAGQISTRKPKLRWGAHRIVPNLQESVQCETAGRAARPATPEAGVLPNFGFRVQYDSHPGHCSPVFATLPRAGLKASESQNLEGRILTLFLRLGCSGSSPTQTKPTRNQCPPMEPNQKPLPSLADVEHEVAAESRAWGRQRLQERLQQLADQHSEVFPPSPTQTPKAHIAQRVRRRHPDR